MTSVIEVMNVSKKFEKKQVLSNVSFKVQPGEIIGLIGQNGAGKSTLIKLLLGLAQPSSGQITVFGTHPTDKAIKDHVGVMFQDSFGISRIKGNELIKLVCSYYSHPLSFENMVALADLGNDLTTMVSKLSGGQRRKLNFALAMAGNPDLLFLDEPTAGMDTNSRYDFWQQVQSLAKSGKTIIVTSHYLAEIEDVATRILFLKDHHFIYDGALNELQKEFTRIIVEFDSDLSEPELMKQLPSGELDSHLQDHYVFLTDDEDQLLTELSPQMARVKNVRVTQRSLDQIFREVTKGMEVQ
ncbi:ABC transporter ATP-binding protein [Lentilactobacillus diolivorans]|uniref:ABC transporter ATP-binding protein n=1 Tax=Lentilactobacillus diolivorans TaxID=179838 RepID=UPI0024689BD9|nr:ABC transporter ATP-binding protein [Lentilactobacillus diolivorans]MDH5104547.1 ABC transporter ATP-binding protein [Lentilactobacillus diolivorans]